MNERHSSGVWVTLEEGGQWKAIRLEEADLYMHEGAQIEKAFAIGFRVGGQDRIYDFVLGKWRDGESTLPDLWH